MENFDIPELTVPIMISFMESCLITRGLMDHGFLVVQLRSSLQKSYGSYHDLVNHYGVSVS